MFRTENVITYPNGDYETSMNILLESVDNDINAYFQRKEEIENLIFMSEATDDDIAMFESSEKNFVGKLGEKIIKFFEMIKKKLTEMSEKFKSIFKSKKSKSDSELKKAMEAHPELALSFYNGIKNGSVKLSDYKDINSLLDTAEKLMKDMETGKIDSKTFSQKIDDALAKTEQKVRPVANILRDVAGIGTSIAAIMFFKKSLIDQAHRYEASTAAYNAKAEEAMKSMIEKADDNETVLRLNTAMKKHNAVISLVNGERSKIIGLIEKISNFGVVKKVTPGKYKGTEKENISTMQSKGNFISNKRLDELNDEEEKRERKVAREEQEYRKTRKILAKANLYGKQNLSDKEWAYLQIKDADSKAKRMTGGGKPNGK